MNATASCSVAAGLAGLILALTITVGTAHQRQQVQTAAGPRLLVTIVVDQMRRDYLDRFGKFAERIPMRRR